MKTHDEIVNELSCIDYSYKQARAALYREERAKVRALQEQCGQLGHKWRLHPTAGDGRYCSVCGISDDSEEV